MLEKTIALGKELSKKEMRQLMGGLAGGTCCVHYGRDLNGNMMGPDCSYSSLSAAHQAADAMASDEAFDFDSHVYYCCASC